MAASGSKIGALHVSLGLDSASFQTGLKNAQTNLNKFGNAAAVGFKVVAATAALAGAAMGVAVKKAIDHADALSKSAQKAGVTTEALSRLAYAADFSDVSLETLTGGLGKLSKAMAEATTNKTSAAATAFKALGVSVTDANGRLRGSDAVFADLSDRFARMNDGATKTALAMQIFGKSGAEMIPLLNGGSAELKRMADEADRLGITLSTKAGKDAERFNDTLTLIGKVLQGVTNKVMESALPALQSLAQTLASPEIASAAMTLATNIIGALDKVIQVIAGITNAIADLSKWMDGPGAADSGRSMAQTYPTGYFKAAGSLNKSLDAISMNGMAKYDYYGSLAGKDGSLNVAKPSSPALFDPVIAGAAKAKAAIEITIPPLTEMQQAIADVGSAFDNAASSAISGLISDVIKGQNAFDGLISKVGQLGDQLIDMALNSAIQGLFGNLLGGLFGGGGMGLGGGGFGRATYGGVGGFFPAFPTFDGGGYTGMGSRSGGVDGRGGFPALLHPNETVVDHTKGGGGGGMVLNQYITGDRNNAAEVARIARQEAMDVLQKYNANPYRKG